MAISYTKLWKLLLDKKMKRTDLKALAGISSSTLAKLGKDEYVSMGSIDRICSVLKCDIADIMSHEQRLNNEEDRKNDN